MKTTEENNKMIAEFMGEHYSNGAFHIKKSEKHAKEWFIITALKYHTSWDWLMPVVEKIEDKGFLTDIFYSLNGNQCVSIKAKDHADSAYRTSRACQHKRKNKKAAIYNAVVQFIEWYNQQNK